MKKIILFIVVSFGICIAKAQNTAYGTNALINLTTGTNNSAFGTNALTNNTIGNDNVAVGEFSLSNNRNGYANIAIGSNALSNNSYTGGHIAIGRNALISNGRGYTNVGIGDLSLSNNTDGSGNVAVGGNSLLDNMFGNFNTAIGMSAGTGIQSGFNNTLVGYDLGSGTGIISGSANTIIGGGITGLASNLSNTIILADGGGNQRLYIDNNGNAGLGTTTPNARLEINSGISNVSGLSFSQLTLSSTASASNGKTLSVDASGNVILTTASGGGGGGSYWNLTGNAGTIDGTNFIGTTDNVPFNIRVNNLKAGRLDQTLNNAFYGLQAGNTNTTGYSNTAIGSQALQSNTSGNSNTSIGLMSLQANIGGGGNTATGVLALNNNTTGNFNTGNGINALLNNGTGDFNTGFGVAALWQNGTGSYNTALGRALATNSNGNNNTGLGFDADVQWPFFNNATAVGSGAVVDNSDKVRLGDNLVTMVEGAAYNTISDGRFKNNVSETDIKGLDFINRLRPVVYNFDTKKFTEFQTQNMPADTRKKYLENKNFAPSTAIRQSGFIAQEVEKAAIDADYNFNGVYVPVNKDDHYSLAYSQFVVPLVKAVQELSKRNDDLKKEMAELKALIKENTNTEGSIKFTETNSSAKLFQNSPNPFNKTTVIKFSLPVTAKQAAITITSMNGVKVKEFDLRNNKGQNVEINGGELVAGTYIYSLMVDGVLVDTKKMILTN